eukprot:gene3134-13147_t
MGETKNSTHAAAGRSRTTQVEYRSPETEIRMPDGTTKTLRRKGQAPATMPKFRKLDPRKYDPQTGLPRGRKKKGGPSPKSAPFSMSLNQVLVAGILAFQVFNFFTKRVLKWGQKSSKELVALDNEDDSDDDDAETAAKRRALRQAMQPQNMSLQMLRKAMPKPKRTNLANQAADTYMDRPRKSKPSWQKMRPSKDVKPRKKGHLERYQDAVKAQAAAILRQEQEANAHRPLALGSSEARPALPAPSSGSRPALPAPAASSGARPAPTGAAANSEGPVVVPASQFGGSLWNRELVQAGVEVDREARLAAPCGACEPQAGVERGSEVPIEGPASGMGSMSKLVLK